MPEGEPAPLPKLPTRGKTCVTGGPAPELLASAFDRPQGGLPNDRTTESPIEKSLFGRFLNTIFGKRKPVTEITTRVEGQKDSVAPTPLQQQQADALKKAFEDPGSRKR